MSHTDTDTDLHDTIEALDMDDPADVFATLDPADVDINIEMSVEDAEALVTATTLAATQARNEDDDDLYRRLLSAQKALNAALDERGEEIIDAANDVHGAD